MRSTLIWISLLLLIGCSSTRQRYLWRGGLAVKVLVPLQSKVSAKITQGYQGYFSHKEDQRFAIDISLPVGTAVLAARGGRVLAVKGDSKVGCDNARCAEQANFILIDHGDGTVGNYFHLQHLGVFVKPGQNVCPGQLIGRSGNTGFSSGPHLHFMVTDVFDESLPVLFTNLKPSVSGGVVYPGMTIQGTTRLATRCHKQHRFSRCGRRTFLHSGILLDHGIPCTAVRPGVRYPISGRSLAKSRWVQIAIRSKIKDKWIYRCVSTDEDGNFATTVSWSSDQHKSYTYLMLSAARRKCSAYAGWSSSLKLRLIDTPDLDP